MRFRLARSSDLPTLRGLLDPGFRVSVRARDRVVDLWSELLATDTNIPAVIEDPSRPYPASIEAFGASAFVSDAFAEEFSSKPVPYLSAIVYERMLEGRSPVLSPQQIRDGNSGAGLNLVVLHFGLRNHDMSDERTQRALQCGSAAFYFFHAGYRMNVLLNEVYGSQAADYMKAGGFRLLSDFSDDPTITGVPDHQHPYLFTLRKEWVVPAAISPLSFLFHGARPQLGLAPAEQRVLMRALLNESDTQIAGELGVSGDAVKKTWRRAYDRVALAAPYLVGNGELAAASEHRAAEKRRHLLDYLRTHLEELRPVARIARVSGKRSDILWA